jgi:hypothetical protein
MEIEIERDPKRYPSKREYGDRRRPVDTVQCISAEQQHQISGVYGETSVKLYIDKSTQMDMC